MTPIESKRKTTWNVINIVSEELENQKPLHYIETFHKCIGYANHVWIGKDRIAYIVEIKEQKDGTDKLPVWLFLNVATMTVLDKDGFYDFIKNEKASIDIPNNIAVNMKPAEMLFIPQEHVVALRLGNGYGLTINQAVDFLSKSLNSVKAGGFRVHPICDSGKYDQILNANRVYALNIKLSFDNGSGISQMDKILDELLNESNAEDITATFKGTNDSPLNMKEDALPAVLVRKAEKTGNVQATIQEKEGGARVKVNTASYPQKVIVEPSLNLFQEVRLVVLKLLSKIVNR